MKKIYIASPIFTDEERALVREYANQFRQYDEIEVYVPMEHKIEDAYSMTNAEWGRKVFEADITALNECDAVVVLYYGLISDSGTAWEQGYAYAKGKDVYVFYVGDKKDAHTSLMVVNGQSLVPDEDLFYPYQT